MNQLFAAMSLIAVIQTLTDSTWQVFHHQGAGDVDEDTEEIGEGTLSIDGAGFGIAAIGTYTADGVEHTLVGKMQLVNWSVRESIIHDGIDVAKDDIYISSHLKESDEDRRVIVEYRFHQEKVAHKIRFKKAIEA